MKHLFLLIVLTSCQSNSSKLELTRYSADMETQEVDSTTYYYSDTYLQLTAGINPDNGKLSAAILEMASLIEGNAEILTEKGKQKFFNGENEFINYVDKRGYKFVSKERIPGMEELTAQTFNFEKK